MKHHFSLFILALLICFLLVSCGGGVDDSAAVASATKAFQIVETNESADTLEGALAFLKGSKDVEVESRTIKLNRNVVDPGVTVTDLDYKLIIDFQNYTYTLKSGGIGFFINNEKPVEIAGGTIRIEEGSYLSNSAVITSNTDVTITGTTVKVEALINAVRTTGGTLNLSGSTNITTNNVKDTIVASEESKVKVNSPEVVLTGGLTIDDRAEVDLGEGTLNLTKNIEKSQESTFSAQNIVPQNENVTEEKITEATHNHEWDDGVVTATATCISEGEITYTCTGEICGHKTRTEVISLADHTWPSEWIVRIPASVDHDGEEYMICTVCGLEKKQAIERDNHEHNLTHHPAKSPTCTEIGWEEYDTCSKCDYSSFIEIPSLGGHDYKAVVTEPTATKQGYTTYTCSRCQDSYVSDYVPAVGYLFENPPAWTWKPDNSGATAEFVSSNDSSHSEILDAVITSTVLTESTCISKGSRRLTATVYFNNTEYTDEKVVEIEEYADHVVFYHPEVPPTCTQTGTAGFWECSVCHGLFSDSVALNPIDTPAVLSALGHDTKGVAWTSTSSGHYKACSRCGEHLEEHDHSYQIYFNPGSGKNNITVSASGNCRFCNHLDYNSMFQPSSGMFVMTMSYNGVSATKSGSKYVVSVSDSVKNQYSSCRWYNSDCSAVIEGTTTDFSSLTLSISTGRHIDTVRIYCLYYDSEDKLAGGGYVDIIR